MRQFALFPIVLTILLMPGVSSADPPRTPSPNCNGSLREHPRYTQVSPGRAEYRFNGLCVTFDGRLIRYNVDGTWTPSEGGGNANASEVFHVEPIGGTPQILTALIGWRCPADPWLNEVQCNHVGQNIPDELRALWTHFDEDQSFPFSRSMIPLNQRPALIAEYSRANDKVYRAPGVSDSARENVAARYATVPSTGPAAATQASQAGIIIVGGKAANSRVRKVVPPITQPAGR